MQKGLERKCGLYCSSPCLRPHDWELRIEAILIQKRLVVGMELAELK